MKPHPLQQRWAAGQPVLNGWLSIANAFTAEIMGEQGYDAITVDLQHGIIDYADSVHMLQALRASGVTPLVRVPWLDPAAIMKQLDAGAVGIICPMINTAEEAAQLVSYVRYPPLGSRSFGPTRAVFTQGADYATQANERVICLAMIETAQGMENLDAIVATPGLDGIYIGPSDLTLGLTGTRYRTGFDREEPEMIATIQHILATAHGAGIRACLHCGSPEYAARAASWGFDLVTLTSDVRLLAAAAAANVADTRQRIIQARN